MGNRKARIITWVLLLILIGISLTTIYILIESKKTFTETIDKFHNTDLQMPIQKNGYTPVKGVDYFDGKDGAEGRNGKDSVSIHKETTIIKEIPVEGKPGQNGVDGKTPEIRCNTKRNQWEIRYSSEDSWKMMGVEPVKCAIIEERIAL